MMNVFEPDWDDGLLPADRTIAVAGQCNKFLATGSQRLYSTHMGLYLA